MLKTVICKTLALAIGLAVTEGGQQQTLVARIPVSISRLENGLRVVVREDHSSPFVTVTVSYRAGTMYEPKGRAGLAHLVEHLMFKGSAHVRPNEHLRLIEDHGGVAGAYTTKELTNYENTVPASDLSMALRLEADRMRSLSITQQHLDLERAAVVEERAGKRPYGNQLSLFGSLFYQSSAYASDPGEISELPRVTIADVGAFHRINYGPNSAAIAVVGDVTHEVASKQIELFFSTVRPRPRRPAPSVDQVQQTSERRLHGTDPTGLGPLVLQGFHIPARTTPDHDALLVAGALLRTRFKRVFAKDNDMVNSALLLFDDVRGPGALIVRLIGNPATMADQLERALDSELAKAVTEPFTQQDTEQAIKTLRRRLLGEDSLRSRANAMAQNALLYDRLEFEELPERLTTIAANDVQRAMRKYITPSNRTTIVLERAPVDTRKSTKGGA